MRRAPILALALVLAGCEAGAGGTSARTTAAEAAAEASVPDACTLLAGSSIRDLLGYLPAATGTTLDREDTFYGRTCLWGEPTGPRGAVGIQVGVADETGHDMVRNRASVLKPTFDLASIPGGVGCMNVAVLPVGGMTGSSVYARVNGRSLLVAVTGPKAGVPAAEALAQEALDALG